MKTKQDIVENWLPRYTGTELGEFGEYILLVNFSNYVVRFAEMHKVEIKGYGKAMQTATANGITIINFGMGSPNAATIMDLLTAIHPKATPARSTIVGEVKATAFTERFNDGNPSWY